MEDRTRVHVFVSGDVQGVNFRQAIADKANEQGVTGWVRNLPDGRVELSDAWGRRVFQWDDGRWIEAESLALPHPDSR